MEDDFTEAVAQAKLREQMLLLSKHADYGPANIANAPGGPVNGLLVRLHDKVARLANLTQTDGQPNYEALTDTADDIANYGTILGLVLEGDWPGVEPTPTGDIEELLTSADWATPPDWALQDPEPATVVDEDNLIGRVVVTPSQVHALCIGRHLDGAPVLRYPVKYDITGRWETPPSASPGQDWYAGGPCHLYRPLWEEGDRVEVAPWADHPHPHRPGIVTRTLNYTDGSQNVYALVAGAPQPILFVASELLAN